MKLLVSEQRAGMTGRAAVVEEQLPPTLGCGRQGCAGQPSVIGAVVGLPLAGDEGAEGVGNLDNGDLGGVVDVIEGIDEHFAIFGNAADTLGDDRPAAVDPVVNRANHVVFTQVAHHFKLRDHREQGLRGDKAVEPRRQPFLGRAVKPVAVEIRARQAAVVEQNADVLMAEVPQGRRVAWDTLADHVRANASGPFGADTSAPFADAK